MKCRFVTLLLTSVLVTTAASAAAERPIPQDSVRQEKRRRDLLEWNRGTLGAAYEKVGSKSARWDKDAREGLDLVARMHALAADPHLVYQGEAIGPLKRAVESGCDDPLILYLFAEISPRDTPESLERLHKAAEVLAKSTYSPMRRAKAVYQSNALKALRKDLTPEGRQEVEKGFESIFDLLVLSVAQENRNEFWQEKWFGLLNNITDFYKYLQPGYQAAFDRVDARLARIPEIKTLRLQLRGQFLIFYAWEARTSAFAPKVTEEGFRKFSQRLHEASDVLNQAWTASPNNARTANLMLIVEKGIGEGNREAMETWFERALKADGDNWEACWTKLDWLDPKWHGSSDEMLAFGRACRDTKNYHGGITLLWGDSLLRAISMSEPEKRAEFFSNPDVLKEIRAVYEGYFKHYIFDYAARSNYAALCFFAGDYKYSDNEFKVMGWELRAATYFPIEAMKEMRDIAAQRAKTP